MQLDELEYFLLGLYPSVVFSIKGKLLFQGLKGRHYDGVVIRTALAENDWTNPWSLSPPAKPARGALAVPIRVYYESLFQIFPVQDIGSFARGLSAPLFFCIFWGPTGCRPFSRHRALHGHLG